MTSRPTNAVYVPANDRGTDPWLEWKRDMMAGLCLFVFLTAIMLVFLT